MKTKSTTLLLTAFAGFLASNSFTLAQTTLYWGGGTADIASNTAVPTTPTGLAGTWNSTINNWASAPTSTNTYSAWSDGVIANFGVTNTSASTNVTGPNANVTLAGAFFNSHGGGNNHLINLQPTTAQTLTLTGTQARLLIQAPSNGSLNGLALGTNLSLGSSATTLDKDGMGLLVVKASNNDAFTGRILFRSGNINLANTASLNGVTTFDLIGYKYTSPTSGSTGGNDWSSPTFTFSAPNSASNRLNDNAVFTLERATIELASGGTSATETISQIVLQSFGQIANSSGTAGSTFTLGHATQGLHRGTTGLGTLIMTVASNDAPRSSVRITNLGGIPADTLLPWATTDRAEFLQIESASSNALKRIISTTNNDAATFAANDNIRVNAAITNSITDDLTLNSLGLQAASGVTQTLTIADTKTLTLTSGGLTAQTGGGGATTISGGNITTPASQFYISTGSNNSNKLVLNSSLTGTYDIIKTGVTSLDLGGTSANTYTGTLHINFGEVDARKSASITGDVNVRTGGGLKLNHVTALASTSNVLLEREAIFNTGNVQANLAGTLTMNGGIWNMQNNDAGITLSKSTGDGIGLRFNGGTLVFSSGAGGALNLLTNLSYASTSTQQALFRKFDVGTFTVRLNTGSNAATAERTFDVADSATLPSGTAEMLVDVPIANGGSGTTKGSLKKTGLGTLQLTASNTYTGGTKINGGTLQLATISAAAQSGLTATANGGSITQNTITFTQPITHAMAVGQALSGTGIQTGRVITAILNDYQVIINGNGANSSLPTDVALNAISRSGSLAAGTIEINNNGTLQIDAGSSVAGTVNVLAGGTLAGSGNITGDVNVAAGGHQAMAVAATPAMQTTRVITGTLSMADSIMDLSATTTPAPGEYVLATASVAITGAPIDIYYNGINGTISVDTTNSPQRLLLTIPGGNTYESWANNNNVTDRIDQDSDDDGVPNGIEYFMGITPASPTFTPNSALNSANQITWPMGENYEGAYAIDYVIQTSPDLSEWTDVPEGSVTIGTASVQFTLTGAAPKFARLKVTGPL